MVLGAAGQDFVAHHQQCGRDGLLGSGCICGCHDHLQEDAPKRWTIQRGEKRSGLRPSGGPDARSIITRVEARLCFVSSRPEPGISGPCLVSHQLELFRVKNSEHSVVMRTLAVGQLQGYFTHVDVR
jgi:hypothetical protein